jgi:hypothetical protein
MITQSELKSLLNYDAETGIFTWKVETKKIKNGQEAGYIRKDGYKSIGINKKYYMAHRLAWLYVHGYIPKVIDHSNHNLIDNSINNLRECTTTQNQWNRKVNKHSISGIKGVSWNKLTEKWLVRLTINGNRKVLGYFNNIELASKAYKEAAQKFHGEFYCEC